MNFKSYCITFIPDLTAFSFLGGKLDNQDTIKNKISLSRVRIMTPYEFYAHFSFKYLYSLFL